MKQVNYALTLLATSLILTACGGSGGGNNDMVSSDHGTPPANADVNKKIILNVEDKDDAPEERIKSAYFDINGHRFNLKDDKFSVDFAVLPMGISTGKINLVGEAVNNDSFRTVANYKSYNQFYSAIMGNKDTAYYENGQLLKFDEPEEFRITTVAGQPTPVANIPVQGTATYQGLAFNENAQGDFKYTINFADKTGSGSITGLNGKNIELFKGGLASAEKAEPYLSEVELGAGQQTFFYGKASSGQYDSYVIGLYGPHAEEVAGAVNDGDYSIGVGGTRGEIK